MTFLEKLKIDRQDLVDSLCENIASLEKIALEQQAEIEKLTTELVGMRGAANSYKMHYDNAQAEIKRLKELKCVNIVHARSMGKTHSLYRAIYTEAIKEFAERLNEVVAPIPAWGRVAEKKIDNLVKEMVGD